MSCDQILAAHLLLFIIVAASIVLMLVRPRGIAEVYWIGGGALLLVLLRLVPLKLAGHAIAAGTDVYLFLTGMMLLSELARFYGVFDWLASVAVEHARGSCVAPLHSDLRGRHGGHDFHVERCHGGGVDAGGARRGAQIEGRAAALSVRVRADRQCGFVCAAHLQSRQPCGVSHPHAGVASLAGGVHAAVGGFDCGHVPRSAVVFPPRARGAVVDGDGIGTLDSTGKLVFIGIWIVAGVLLAASAMNKDLGLPRLHFSPDRGARCSRQGAHHPVRILRDISWSVLPLVAGLFILMEAIVSVGALRYTAAALAWVEKLPAALGALMTGAVVGFGNNLVNNLPLGLIAGSTLNAAHVQGVIQNAVLIGVDLGPNLSVTGSLATILWLIAMRREGLHVGFGTFLKVGVIAMPVALMLALLSRGAVVRGLSRST